MGYFLRRGVANLSLRPLARATGTSARMLVHHFGSKEQLITAVMKEMQATLQSLFEELVRNSTKSNAPGIILAFWQSITNKKNLPYVRLLFEVHVLAIQNPVRYGRYLADTSGSWLRLIYPALPQGKQRAETATLITAVIDGLLLELLSTEDSRRTTKALNIFVRQLAHKKSRPQKNRRKT